MAARLPNTYDAVGDSLASPLTSHLLAYNSAPVSTAIPARGVKVSDSPAPVEKPVVVAVSGSGIEASMGLNQSVALTGLPNSPGTSAGANSPGLSNEPEGESGKTAFGGTMLFWVLIIAVIIGLVWYYNPGNILQRS